MYGNEGGWQLDLHERVLYGESARTFSRKRLSLVALLRVRNERDLIEDTLRHLSQFADCICVYDDASDDGTLEVVRQHPLVALTISNRLWRAGIENRSALETRHRGVLLNYAKRLLDFDWCICCDADERYVGDIVGFVRDVPSSVDGARISLFDAYMTPDDFLPYRRGQPLMGFRKWFGPERRRILMMWRNSERVEFVGLDSREPTLEGRVVDAFYCQHYGKSISEEQWEDTCQYYVANFPWLSYGKKWSERSGKAIHSKSDFGRDLMRWGCELFENAVDI